MTLLTRSFCFLIPWHLKQTFHEARFGKQTRYYGVRLQQDLLGDWVVIATHGRIRTKLGQSRTQAFSNFDDAFLHFCFIASVRYQRKYQLTGYRCDDQLFIYLLTMLLNPIINPVVLDKGSKKPRVNIAERVSLEKTAPKKSTEQPHHQHFFEF